VVTTSFGFLPGAGFFFIGWKRHSTLSGEEPSLGSRGSSRRRLAQIDARSHMSRTKRSFDERHCSTTKSPVAIIRSGVLIASMSGAWGTLV